jgi:predicted RNase H-like HicB family nuclease
MASSSWNLSRDPEGGWNESGWTPVIELRYSLVIEATDDPTFFGFYSPDLEGFSGVGHSVEDCLYQARWGMQEHLALLKERGLPIPPQNPTPSCSSRTSGQRPPVPLARVQ